MRSHEQCAALLDAFIDGALSEADAARVRQHLTECAECQSYVSDALVMRELFPGLEETPVPEGFGESILSALPAQQVLWRTQWKKIALPLAACFAVVLLARGFSGGSTKSAADMAAMDGGGAAFAEESAELYGAASDRDEADDVATLQAAGGVTPDNGAMARSVASDGVTPDNGAMARSVASDGVTPDNGARAKEAPDDGAKSQGVSARKRDAKKDDETPEMSETPSARSAGASSDTESYRAMSAQQDVSEPSDNASMLGAAPPDSVEDAQPERVTDAMPESVPITTDAPPDTDAAPPGSVPVTTDTPSDSVTDTPSDSVPVTTDAPPDTDAAPSDTDGWEDEIEPEELFATLAGADALTVSVWRLADNAAPIMERYPPDAVTDGGKWYVMTSAEFRALCERFPDIEITSGPETVEAAALPDGAPEPQDSDAVYLFAPIGEAAPISEPVEGAESPLP